MSKFDELLDKLKTVLGEQTNSWEEDIPEDIWDEYFGDYEEVCNDIDVDAHRWYETAIVVIKIFDRYLGIRVISKLYSEISSYSDIIHEYEVFEMEPMSSITYKIKGM